MSNVAPHLPCMEGAKMTGVTHRADTSRVSLRAWLTVQPRLIIAPEIHPPNMLPTSARSQIAIIGGPTCLMSRLNCLLRNLVEKKMRKPQLASVMNLLAMKAHAWR